MSSQSLELAGVDLAVIELEFAGTICQTLVINLPQPSLLIQPNLLAQLPLPADLDLSRGVILFGKAPTWLYGYLIECCHVAPWIGCYNAPLGAAVIVHSRLPHLYVGQTIASKLNSQPGAAILIGGPPDSGKSLLCRALQQNMAQLHPECRLFVHRANWDGQGNWAYESQDVALTDKLVLGFDAKLHWHPEAAKLVPRYFQDQADSVQNLRKVQDLVLVDVGGVPQPEKHPVVEACSHYLIISREPEAIPAWHQLCAASLNCLAVVHSQPDTEPVFLQSPLPEFSLSLKTLAETGTLPNRLLDSIYQLVGEQS